MDVRLNTLAMNFFLIDVLTHIPFTVTQIGCQTQIKQRPIIPLVM